MPTDEESTFVPLFAFRETLSALSPPGYLSARPCSFSSSVQGFQCIDEVSRQCAYKLPWHAEQPYTCTPPNTHTLFPHFHNPTNHMHVGSQEHKAECGSCLWLFESEMKRRSLAASHASLPGKRRGDLAKRGSLSRSSARGTCHEHMHEQVA